MNVEYPSGLPQHGSYHGGYKMPSFAISDAHMRRAEIIVIVIGRL
jgi:hypothetical protein